jgi:glycosyltransferase involved in cell wall biosynthesis
VRAWLGLWKGRTPLFSIIVPTFNSNAKIGRTIDSVLAQNRDLLELIVVDGGSGDDTVATLRARGDALRWISEPDEGVYNAMNKGIAMAHGRFLYFLGAGDMLRAGVLKIVARHLPWRRPGFVYGNVFMHDRQLVWDGPWTAEKFRTRTPCQQAIFYDRRIFARHGLFDLRFKTLADYALNIRCFGDRKIKKVFFDEIIADYEGAGYSATFRDEAFYSERPALLKEHLGLEEKKRSRSPR